jgi:hypothetical protein
VGPEHLKFGGGFSGTLLHPIVLVALVISVILVLSLRRKYIMVPVLAMCFLVPVAQQFYVAGLHLLIARLVIIAGLIRLASAKSSPEDPRLGGGFNAIDKIFIFGSIYHVVAFLILFSFDSGALANQFAFIWDTVGGFFVVRFMIHDNEDILRACKVLSCIAVVLAVCLLNEHFRMQNVFGFLGGVRIVPELRDGGVRAQGPFQHPLITGTFGATLLPLFFLLWNDGKAKVLAVIGGVSATIIALMANSSTPLLAYIAGFFALCLWPIRGQMRMVRWGLVIVLVSLNIVMKAPVWFLISHISLTGSSSTDHRAYLVDLFIRHFFDWWLIGTNSNASWGWDMWDTSNQYVADGEGGGLAYFACLIALISVSFSRIGRARRVVEGDKTREMFFWLLGAAMFSHAVAFFGISYFDNIRMSWYLLLAMITAATFPVLRTAQAPASSEQINSPAGNLKFKPAMARNLLTRHDLTGNRAGLMKSKGPQAR